jgi:hypothetical protein
MCFDAIRAERLILRKFLFQTAERALHALVRYARASQRACSAEQHDILKAELIMTEAIALRDDEAGPGKRAYLRRRDTK